MIGHKIMQNDDGNRGVVDDKIPTDIAADSGAVTVPSTQTATSEDRIVESLYRHVIESMCQDVASNMHELIKTGAGDVVPSSWKLFMGTKIPTRRELYPELYNGSDFNAASEGNKNEEDTREGGDEAGENMDPKTLNRIRMTDEEIQGLLDKYAVDLPTSSSYSNVSPTVSRKRRTPRDMAEEEEERRLLSKIKKGKESNYKDDSEDIEDDVTNGDDDDDDEDFKMDDAEGDDDDDDDLGGAQKKKRTLSSSSATPSSDSIAEPAITTDLPSSSSNSISNINSHHPKTDIWGKTPSKEPKNRLCLCQLCGRLVSTSRFASHLDKCMGLSTSRGGPSSISSSMASAKNMLMSSGMLTKKAKRGSTLTKK